MDYRNLIEKWHTKASEESEEDYFSKFVFEYLAFIAFLKTQRYPNNDKDRQSIQRLKRCDIIKEKYREKINSKKELKRYILAISYTGHIKKAKEAALNLIKKYPNDLGCYELYLNILTKNKQAKKTLLTAYNYYKLKKTSNFFYLYVKNIIEHGKSKDIKKVYKLILSKKNDNFIKLAKASYFFKFNNLKKAVFQLNKINDIQHDDYHILYAKIYIKQN